MYYCLYLCYNIILPILIFRRMVPDLLFCRLLIYHLLNCRRYMLILNTLPLFFINSNVNNFLQIFKATFCIPSDCCPCNEYRNERLDYSISTAKKYILSNLKGFSMNKYILRDSGPQDDRE